jgi:hypothetical protein
VGVEVGLAKVVELGSWIEGAKAGCEGSAVLRVERRWRAAHV